MTSTCSRVAIVTGGSRGIGRAVAERLGADGFAVVVNYAGHKTEADAAVEVIESTGARAIAVQADVADEVAVSAMFDAAEDTFGGVDVVVHAAGIMALGMVADMDLDVFDRQVRTNLRGRCARTCAARSWSTSRPRAGCAAVARSSTSPAPCWHCRRPPTRATPPQRAVSRP